MEKKAKRTNVRYLCELALLVAIELVMKLIGLGSVQVGLLYMSFLTVPIAVGAMLLGPMAGTILGAVFGAVSFKDAVTGVSLMTGAFLQIAPLKTLVLCLGTRMLMGFCVGWLFRFLHLLDRKRERLCYVLGALSAPLLNTLFFMGYIVLAFYQTDYIQNLVSTYGAANPIAFVVMLVGVQGLVETVVCTVVGGAVTKGAALALGLRKSGTERNSAE